jgi:hypothetical protein
MTQNKLKIKMSKEKWDNIGKNPNIKFAQFEGEGVNPMEHPSLEQFESQQEWEKWRSSPPYKLPELVDEIGKIATVIDSKISDQGMELTVEFKDGKLYTITVGPYISK